ncbi:MAG: TonB-dependent receptor [Opitutus sp.]|nr:TonB-dependent receptor [Opitutus sp.]MCS6246189.1 TonB-dependent receptor [Opitutus sp.]MCS6273097.1 TonB-dependent receptor [Opitutus sp.]MCS6278528.1 TonB-dependent receptor [Opitutus sp.]MCS6300070.1 TonB-dependent receptor [Opitutus sp.]
MKPPRNHQELRRKLKASRITLLIASVSSAALAAGGRAAPEPADLPAIALAPMIVTASRSAQPVSTLPVTATVFTAADLRASPALALDDTLRAAPAFSLFRRSGSLTANPTAQGVSLRGLGPSGASRSLVLLDGVPLNDPFGGWVAWTKLPKLSIAAVESVPGGGSSVWGNASLGGSVQLLTTPPAGNHGTVEALIGDFNTRGAELAVTTSSADDRHSATVDAAAFASAGAYLLRGPGAIDRRADLDYKRTQATLRNALTESIDLKVSARLYAEKRGNGTPLQRNATDERFFSATLANSPAKAHASPVAWTAVTYVQAQSFASYFSAVNAARTAETPASNQYDVPATALGAGATATWGTPTDDAMTTMGLDARHVAGVTREAFLFSAPLNDFTRDRRAGGEQTFTGVFARHEHQLGSTLRASAGARVDYWETTQGFRREVNTQSGALTLDQQFAAQGGTEFSPALGLVWQPTPELRARGSVYQSFRVPTLNEYYRPFRVGSVTTNANPTLAPEALTGYETGFDLGRPDAPLGASVTTFVNELHDAVTNVTLAANTRERRNLDHVRVAGVESSVRARPHAALTLGAAHLLTDARVINPGPSAPAALDGNRLAQVPRNTFTTSATWKAPWELQFTARARWMSAAYEDDENTLRLSPAATVDFGVARRFGRRWEGFIAIENAFDAEVETGRTASGIVNTAPPRWSRAGLRYDW